MISNQNDIWPAMKKLVEEKGMTINAAAEFIQKDSNGEVTTDRARKVYERRTISKVGHATNDRPKGFEQLSRHAVELWLGLLSWVDGTIDVLPVRHKDEYTDKDDDVINHVEVIREAATGIIICLKKAGYSFEGGRGKRILRLTIPLPVDRLAHLCLVLALSAPYWTFISETCRKVFTGQVEAINNLWKIY